MFSEKIYTDIVRVIQQALTELHGLKAVDQITITPGYMQMSSRKIARYDIELRPPSKACWNWPAQNIDRN